MRNRLLLILLFTCLSGWVSAQTGSISGKVTGPDGGALAGAAVYAEGVGIGTTTSQTGEYLLTLNPGTYTIKASYVGYQEISKSITVTGNQTVTYNIQMKEDDQLLSEAVVIGYGTKHKEEITGNIVTVKGKEVADQPTPSFEAALQGRAAGVQVTVGSGLAGSPSLIRIRGVASVSSSGDPLYIIDGVPVNQNYFSRGNSGAMNQNPLATLNPLDIENIEILKDAAATAIYGARGSNGVIIITTKRAKKKGWNFEFSSRVGTSKPTYVPQMLNSQEYLQLYQEAWENDGGVGRAPLPNRISWEEAQKTNTDWVDQTIHTGVKQMYSMTTGYKANKWGAYLNMTRDDNGSYLRDNRYVRNSARLNVDYEPIKDFKIQLSSSFVKATNYRVYNGWSGGLGAAMSTALPIYPIYDSTGEYNLSIVNPVAYRNLMDWKTFETRSISSLNVSYKITEKISVSGFAGFDFSNVTDDLFLPGKLIFADHAGQANRDVVKNLTQTMNARINYKAIDTKKQNLAIMLGAERVYATSHYRNYFMDSIGSAFYKNKGLISDKIAGIETGTPWALNSVFSRIDYSYKKRYLVDITMRTDGSSKFGENNLYGFFPAIGAGWIISEEKFMHLIPQINFLKLKSGYGISGNVPTENNAFRQVWIGSTNNIHYNNEATVYPTNHENPDLKWETSHIFDVSLEIGLFKNRITSDIAFYNKTTTDILLQLATPSSTGFSSYWQNTGKFRNWGVEYAITSRNISKKNFSWETQFNIARNYNKVLDLGIYFQDALSGGTNDTRVVVGQPLGTNYLVKFSHVDPQTGQPVYLDKDGNETYTWSNDNRVAVGTVLPKAFGGISNNIRWGQFYLSTTFVYKIGGNIYNSSAKRQNGVVTDWNMTTDYFDRWTQPGDVAKYPMLSMNTASYGLPPDPYQYNTTLFLESGSYLRLRNISLTYTVPKKLLKDKLRRIELGITGYNILTFTKFTGGDPEIARDFENPQDRNMSSNISYLTAPQEKSILFNLNVTL
ncbi:MAG: SusC/RagA family TonB-linked outer membrane protein [Bacteroidetes bacterium]|nr:SusC/RagA family TonB-linked outer membrane protein [Bacteroidota bacterium]